MKAWNSSGASAKSDVQTRASQTLARSSLPPRPLGNPSCTVYPVPCTLYLIEAPSPSVYAPQDGSGGLDLGEMKHALRKLVDTANESERLGASLKKSCEQLTKQAKVTWSRPGLVQGGGSVCGRVRGDPSKPR